MEDTYQIAAMYAVSIARGHVFNDANKRTALLTALTYLKSEGILVLRDPQLEEVMVAVAEGTVEYQELSEIFYGLANLK